MLAVFSAAFSPSRRVSDLFSVFKNTDASLSQGYNRLFNMARLTTFITLCAAALAVVQIRAQETDPVPAWGRVSPIV
jgi:hypothetical protein